MASPRFELSKEYDENDSFGGISPSWCVAFVRYSNPDSVRASQDAINQTEPLMVISNDCIGISITNAKNSFAKTCQLTMKAGQVYYQNAVSPGDWVFVWINNYQDKIDQIAQKLNNYKNSPGSSDSLKGLTSFNSGFKFFGRVLGVSTTDSISADGARTVTQNISCQAFIELASSVYYTEITKNILTPKGLANNQGIQTADEASVAFTQNGLNNFAGLNQKLRAAFQTNSDSINGKSPDESILLLFILAMGVDKTNNKLPTIAGPALFNDSIKIPPDVYAILNSAPDVTNSGGIRNSSTKEKKVSTNFRKLWESYSLLMGLQQYKGGDAQNQPHIYFNPSNLENTSGNIKTTSIRCKGTIPFIVSPWSNKPVWSILSEYLNPVVNEMYTALRLDVDGRIKPTLIVREQPFSTGLFNQVETQDVKKSKKIETSEKAKQLVSGISEKIKKNKGRFDSDNSESLKRLKNSNKQRSMYWSQPRWVLNEKTVKEISTSTTESSRINFTQVFTDSFGLNWSSNTNSQVGNSPSIKSQNHEAEIINGNYAHNKVDISRNGLRADIQTTPYDIPFSGNAILWAKMRADWLFNGQLKLNAVVNCQGIVEPIVEGDNCEFRDVLYHIESVSHRAALAGGRKSFVTTLELSRGIVASSLEQDSDVPKYVRTKGLDSSSMDMPGITDVQILATNNRDGDGDLVKKTVDEIGSAASSVLNKIPKGIL